MQKQSFLLHNAAKNNAFCGFLNKKMSKSGVVYGDLEKCV